MRGKLLAVVAMASQTDDALATALGVEPDEAFTA
jgi:hypothetical protein